MTQEARPTSRRRDASRNHDAVIEVFREAMKHGEPLTLEEIAHRAGIGVATLYRHFPNRAALQQAVYVRLVDEEIAPIADVIDPADPHGSFIEVAVRLIDLVQGSQVEGAAPLDLPALMGDLVTEFTDPLSLLLVEGQRTGVLRPDITFIDAIWLLQLVATGFSVPSADDAVKRRYLSLVFDAISVGGPTPLPPLSA